MNQLGDCRSNGVDEQKYYNMVSVFIRIVILKHVLFDPYKLFEIAISM